MESFRAASGEWFPVARGVHRWIRFQFSESYGLPAQSCKIKFW